MSNFSFSHIVFKRLVSKGRQKVSLCGNGLSKLDLFGSKILMTKDDPLPQPNAIRTNIVLDHEE